MVNRDLHREMLEIIDQMHFTWVISRWNRVEKISSRLRRRIKKRRSMLRLLQSVSTPVGSPVVLSIDEHKELLRGPSLVRLVSTDVSDLPVRFVIRETEIMDDDGEVCNCAYV